MLVAANAVPVIVGRLLGGRFGRPIDEIFGGRCIFGSHKTWRGLLSGVLACALIGALFPCGYRVGAAFGVLSLAGDLASSYVKRRLQLESGRKVPLLDQLPEALLPMWLLAPLLGLTLASIAGTATVFVVLDTITARWRPPARREAG